jgi:hypothetical protein
LRVYSEYQNRVESGLRRGFPDPKGWGLVGEPDVLIWNGYVELPAE